jgi:hypothetical protein
LGVAIHEERRSIAREKATAPEPGAPQAKVKRTPAKNAKPAKKAGRAKKPAFMLGQNKQL